jgi:hypothetical protein
VTPRYQFGPLRNFNPVALLANLLQRLLARDLFRQRHIGNINQQTDCWRPQLLDSDYVKQDVQISDVLPLSAQRHHDWRVMLGSGNLRARFLARLLELLRQGSVVLRSVLDRPARRRYRPTPAVQAEL